MEHQGSAKHSLQIFASVQPTHFVYGEFKQTSEKKQDQWEQGYTGCLARDSMVETIGSRVRLPHFGPSYLIQGSP